MSDPDERLPVAGADIGNPDRPNSGTPVYYGEDGKVYPSFACIPRSEEEPYFGPGLTPEEQDEIDYITRGMIKETFTIGEGMSTSTEHNCKHQGEGWCLDCVQQLAREKSDEAKVLRELARTERARVLKIASAVYGASRLTASLGISEEDCRIK